jgi:hypothetical protein
LELKTADGALVGNASYAIELGSSGKVEVEPTQGTQVRAGDRLVARTTEQGASKKGPRHFRVLLTARDAPGGQFGWAVPAAIAGAFLLAGLVWFVVRRRRRSPSAEAPLVEPDPLPAPEPV